ncbi:N-ethylmaleimide-sensitive factor attachment protein, alpha b isoform X3 [Ictalurus punctatus]|uniref:N-ethylmaleimide-sensitive factor attachment protein, alpha b isoform X3 n=1 Tax=Ictalurus punctatus TaxID=7998 RepID=A0A2D0QWF0_ICTPU|nr:N-ethylmaleimide-sensitive factor attachment protein, alpha b isoform X3 [Ictalurus punctatus]
MDNSTKEKEAIALMAEAEKKVRSSQSFFGSLFGGSSKMEEACDTYGRAANMFKMAKNWSAAGNAFCQAALLHLQMQSKHDAATNFIDAGNAFKKADPQEAINCLIRAIEIYTDMGRFTIAAKHHVTIAEIYETELVDIDKAIAHYEQAADYYKGEESTSSANKCLLKVAAYAAQLEQYPKAIEIYEQALFFFFTTCGLTKTLACICCPHQFQKNCNRGTFITKYLRYCRKTKKCFFFMDDFEQNIPKSSQ